MSLDELPSNIEKGIEQFAQQHRLSHDEAVVKLLETGLRRRQSARTIKGLSGEPMSDEEAEIVDQAIAQAMEARRQRFERLNP